MAAPSPGPAPRQARGPSLPFPQSSAWLLPQFPPLYAELPRVGVRGSCPPWGGTKAEEREPMDPSLRAQATSRWGHLRTGPSLQHCGSPPAQPPEPRCCCRYTAGRSGASLLACREEWPPFPLPVGGLWSLGVTSMPRPSTPGPALLPSAEGHSPPPHFTEETQHKGSEQPSH